MAIQGTQPYNRSLLITKSDTVNFDGFTATQCPAPYKPPCCDAIFVGGAGIVVAVLEDGSTAQHTCVAGEILPIKAIRVNSSTTSATLMQAMYYQ